MNKGNQQALEFFIPKPSNDLNGAIYFDTGISAGFPSPADDFMQQRLSLDSELIKNKEATFFARVSGQSMIDAGLNDNDLLVIDRSLSPSHNRIAVCFLDGEFTVKRLKVKKEEVWLQPENKNYKAIKFYNKMNMTRISNTKLDYADQNNFCKGYIYKATKKYLEGLIH